MGNIVKIIRAKSYYHRLNSNKALGIFSKW